jgi:hypothetical protein
VADVSSGPSLDSTPHYANLKKSYYVKWILLISMFVNQLGTRQNVRLRNILFYIWTNGIKCYNSTDGS